MVRTNAGRSRSPANLQPKKLLSVGLYTIGLITPLSFERGAVACMMDEEHESPSELKRSNDPNQYSLGRMGQHNVVLTSFAAGDTGTIQATAITMLMLNTFPNIKFGLVIGIGAGIPRIGASVSRKETYDIRLGDVVVSQPTDRSGGVFQYDFVRISENENYEPKDRLSKPPDVLLKALSALQADHERNRPRAHQYLQIATKENPKWAKRVKYPEGEVDAFFPASYVHEGGLDDCSRCNTKKQIPRESREDGDFQIHYGLIGSGNAVIRNAKLRDEIVARESKCICLEMEAAGVVNNFPCLVVRGISDYADSHKNDTWKSYAASTAAAVAKEILYYVHSQKVTEAATAAAIMGHDAGEIINVRLIKAKQFLAQELEQRRNRFLQVLFPKSSTFEQQKKLIPSREPGTCKWFIEHQHYQSWLKEEAKRLLWISANTKCGKSVLCKSLIDKDLPSSLPANHTICYFFFKQGTLGDPLCAILHQFLAENPCLLDEQILKIHENRGDIFVQSFDCLWEILLSLVKKKGEREMETGVQEGPVICVLDALDECPKVTQEELMRALARFCDSSRKSAPRLKFLVTCQPESNIITCFEDVRANSPSILRIQAEAQEIIDQINVDVTRVVDSRLREIIKNDDVFHTEMLEKLVSVPNRTYLFADLALDELKKNLRSGSQQKQCALSSTPRTVYDAYERILNRDPEQAEQRRQLLSIVIMAYRALTVDELIVAWNNVDSDRKHTPYFTSKEAKHDFVRKKCGNFVNIIDEKVYLIHRTARDFLLSKKTPQERNLARNDQFSNLEINSRAVISMNNQHRWEHSFDHQRTHGLLAELCAGFLDPTENHDRLPEFEKYCVMHLFAHLYEAGPYVSEPLAAKAIKILEDQTSQWNLIYEQMPNYRHESINFCPESDEPILNLVSYLGIPVLIKQALKDTTFIKGRKGAYSWLCIAAAKGDQNSVRAFLSKYGAGPDIRSKDNITPLHAVVMCGRLEMIDILIKAGAAIEATTKDGRTALHLAIEERRYEIAEELIKRNANLEAKIPENGYHPLHLATTEQLPEFVQLLLDAGAKVDMRPARFLRSEECHTALHIAARLGNVEILKMLLRKTADLRAWGVLNEQKSSALYIAAIHDQYSAAELLLCNKADTNVRQKDGYSPLSYAVANGNTRLVKLLLDHDSRVSSIELSRAMLPSELTSKVANQGILELLLLKANELSTSELRKVLCNESLTVDANTATRLAEVLVDAKAPITHEAILAALKRWVRYQSNPQLIEIAAEVIVILLQAMSNRIPDSHVCASMRQEAIQCKCWTAVQQLIQLEMARFEDIEPISRRQWFLWAAQNGDAQSMNFLLQRGIIVHITDNTGRTALSHAISYGLKQKPQEPLTTSNTISEEKAKQFINVATMLLEAGANPDSVDRQGYSVGDWATWAGNTEAADLLAKYHRDPLRDRQEPVVGEIPIVVARRSSDTTTFDTRPSDTITFDTRISDTRPSNSRMNTLASESSASSSSRSSSKRSSIFTPWQRNRET